MAIATTGETTKSDDDRTGNGSEIITHEQIWHAIDRLAFNKGCSTSALAKQAGLDSTSLNKSKRFTTKGRERWPSTQSLAKILKITNTPVDEFLSLGVTANPLPHVGDQQMPATAIPLTSSENVAETGAKSARELADQLPHEKAFSFNLPSEQAFAVELPQHTDPTEPPVEEIVIVEPDQSISPKNKVLVKTVDGVVRKLVLLERGHKALVFVEDANQNNRFELPVNEVDWMARIAFTV